MAELELRSFSFPAMGTECTLHLHAADAETANTAAAAAEDEVVRIERRYSRYSKDSRLSAINRVADGGGSLEVDEETAGLLDYAFSCHSMSGGLFDITSGVLYKAWPFSAGQPPSPPDRETIARLLPRVGLDKVEWRAPPHGVLHPRQALDFGGIGKEYAADRAAAICAALGIHHGLIDLGGDIHVIGPHPDGTPWSIHIRHPRQAGADLAIIGLAKGGLATSGDYERFIEIDGRRYCHILDPRTGVPAEGVLSATVVAPTAAEADSLSTALYVLGPTGLARMAPPGGAVGAILVVPGDTAGAVRVLTANLAEDVLSIEPGEGVEV